MSKSKDRYERKIIKVLVDTENDEETSLIAVMEARLAMQEANDRLKRARQKNAGEPEAQPAEPTKQESKPKGGIKKSSRFKSKRSAKIAPETPTDVPKGKNKLGLLDIDAKRQIDHAAIAEILFGEDTPKNRRRTYARVNHWKSKKWLVETDDGEWIVPRELLELLCGNKEDLSWLAKIAEGKENKH